MDLSEFLYESESLCLFLREFVSDCKTGASCDFYRKGCKREDDDLIVGWVTVWVSFWIENSSIKQGREMEHMLFM